MDDRPAEGRNPSPWLRAGLGLVLAAILGVGLVPPYEILDGEFRKIDGARKAIWSPAPLGRGFWRLDLYRICIEEGVLLAAAAVLAKAGKRRVLVPPGADCN